MISVQDFFFAFKPHVHITGGNGFKVHRQPKRYTDTRKRVSQHFAYGVEVACQLVHSAELDAALNEYAGLRE